ncbi:hypothetical protein M9Y10_011049 [Tritrichomonas musculus]|uniref:Uncharacterized protein n=1 Tax=Tritrichomonas musculus TaxID=1915356 RepID=A0ABR2INY2_9EUKA
MKIVSSDISLAVKFFTSIFYSSVSTKASAGRIISNCRILLSKLEFNAPVSLFSDIGHICRQFSTKAPLETVFLTSWLFKQRKMEKHHNQRHLKHSKLSPN